MAARKNHHFVPQFYFRRFSLDQRSICVLQRDTGKTIMHAPVKNQASKDWFYGDDAIEAALGEVEGACSAALRQLDEVKDPRLMEEEQIQLILVWLTLQRSRTMTARQASQPLNDKILRMLLETEIANDSDLDENAKQKLLSSLGEIKSNPLRNHLMEIKIAMESAEILSDLTPLLLFNKTNRPFVFGDAPVVLYNGFYRNVQLRGVLGLNTPGLMVFFPLLPTVILALVDSSTYTVKHAHNNGVQVRNFQDVMALNKLQIHSASTCVYFHDFQFAPYVTELWRQEQKILSRHAGIVNEAPGFSSETGESMGDIVHGFQPQLPYRLSLSFLQHNVLGDEEYRFSMRNKHYQ